MKIGNVRWIICMTVFVIGLVAISSVLSPESDPLIGNASNVLTVPVSVTWFSVDEKARQLLRKTAGEDQVPVAPHPLEVTTVEPETQDLTELASGASGQDKSRLDTWEVRPGDSMWKIARDVLGDVNRMNEVIAANPGITPDRLMEGQVIRLPAARESRSKRAVAEIQIHTVKDGESLASIARHYYGDEDWTRIQSANLDQVKNPDRLKVGMRLKIPSRSRVRGGGDR